MEAAAVVEHGGAAQHHCRAGPRYFITESPAGHALAILHRAGDAKAALSAQAPDGHVC